MDLHPREGKYGLAGLFPITSGITDAQLPTAALVTNFPDPSKSPGGPALMEHGQVITFFHEFAHLLDVDQTHFDGIPAGFHGECAREWVAVAEKEMERLRHGRSAFDEYGAHDPVEFLGVAVEAFFEIPQVVRRRHRAVYALLSAYFGQDPAAWDDVRGLRE